MEKLEARGWGRATSTEPQGWGAKEEQYSCHTQHPNALPTPAAPTNSELTSVPAPVPSARPCCAPPGDPEVKPRA